MAEITIPFKGWYEAHRKFTVTFTPGVTTLVGRNGSGKSSMIHEILTYAKSNKLPILYYESHEMGNRSISSFMIGGSLEETGNYYNSSEGERIIVSLSYRIGQIKQFLNEHQDDEIVFVLFDALDSGLSINMIRDLQEVFGFMINDYPNLFIVNAANNYEFTKNSRCIIAKNGRDIEFKNYDDFVKFIMKKPPIKKKKTTSENEDVNPIEVRRRVRKK